MSTTLGHFALCYLQTEAWRDHSPLTPLYTIQRLMGHKSIKMTERYAHLCPDVQAAAVETMLAG